MSFQINGKGDTYRKVNIKKYDANYDEIEWKSKKIKKENKEGIEPSPSSLGR